MACSCQTFREDTAPRCFSDGVLTLNQPPWGCRDHALRRFK